MTALKTTLLKLKAKRKTNDRTVSIAGKVVDNPLPGWKIVLLAYAA